MPFQPAISFCESGGRPRNEDCIFPETDTAGAGQALFIVCDGVGGHSGGEVASKLACHTIAQALHQAHPITPAAIQSAVLSACALFTERISENPELKGMASTMALLYLDFPNAVVAHLGDSPIYWFRQGEIRWKSKDHTWVQEMLDRQVLTPEQAADHPRRNVITRAVHSDLAPNAPEIIEFNDLLPGDLFFLCTDGVGERLSDTALCALLFQQENLLLNLEAIRQACLRTPSDNFAAWLVPVQAAWESESAIPIAEEAPLPPSIPSRLARFLQRISPFSLHDDE